MTTHILGISAYYHDAAAALIREGTVVAAAQEERFSRLKHDSTFPRRAVEFCLSEARIGPEDLSAAIFYEKPLVKFDRLLESTLAYAPRGYEAFRTGLPSWIGRKLNLREEVRRELGPRFRAPLHFADHHESHAASAFFPSPFEDAAILTLDAVGEWSTSTIGRGKGHRIQLLRELRFPHSLGMLYSAFTFYTGFRVNSGEYKLMGLAPYGTPRYRDLILRDIVRVHDDGSIWLDMSYFDFGRGTRMTSERFHDLFDGPPRRPESPIRQKDMDLAASVQAVTEEVVLRAARYAHELTGSPRLVMAGGVALNCVANGRLLKEGPFESVWVQPAAGDAGGALGAALLVWHHVLDQGRRIEPGDAQQGSRLGPAFPDGDIALFLDSVGAVHHRPDTEEDLLQRVVDLLEEGRIVGWLSGRMEYGPRALGSRSILGDARSPAMQRTMNLKVKFRESFRPFAPMVLREHAHEVFELREGEDSPYMLFVVPVREEWRVPLDEEDRRRMADPDLRVRVAVARSRIPAVTHVDYSARVQTVDRQRHGRLYRLMRRFHQKTGCPVLVNTSFNIRGEPIVCSPAEAYRCFMATDIDVLVLEGHLLLKDEQPLELAVDAEAYRNEFDLD